MTTYECVALIISGLALLISGFFSGFAFWNSCKARKIANNANSIAEEANRIAIEAISEDKVRNKEKTKSEIIHRITENWSKKGKAVLISEWKIYKNKGFSLDEFDEIWKTASLRVKDKPPKESAKVILSNNNKS
ncbi:MAG: hypothetical protein V3V61_07220 [Gammaproteobacteria bacterium]